MGRERLDGSSKFMGALWRRDRFRKHIGKGRTLIETWDLDQAFPSTWSRTIINSGLRNESLGPGKEA